MTTEPKAEVPSYPRSRLSALAVLDSHCNVPEGTLARYDPPPRAAALRWRVVRPSGKVPDLHFVNTAKRTSHSPRRRKCQMS
jgi:hypothetical protein